jgi:sugar/nucleoside kinase (ribokinase family)
LQCNKKTITLTKENNGIVFAAHSMSIIKNNPRWAKNLLSNSDVVSLNKEEAQEFTNNHEIITIVDYFLDLCIEIISITDGANGSIISDGKEVISSSVYEVSTKDTTGAGDAFLSGIILLYLNNFSLDKTAKIASALAALECSEIGVRIGLPKNIEELENFIGQNILNQKMIEFS